jgi:outer membrane protein
MLRIRHLAVAAATFAFAGSAHALPLVDVEVGARYWQANPDGFANYKGEDVDLQDDLGFDKEGTPNFYARAALPLITLDAEYTNLDYSGTAKRTFEFGNLFSETISAPTSLEARLLHGGALFSLPLPFIDVGVGVGATNIDADYTVATETGSANVTLPVAKAELRASLPMIPLNVGVRGNGIGFRGDQFTDITAEVGLEMGLLQLRAGYRQIALEYDGDDLTVDNDFSGPFAGLHLAF